MIKNILEEIKIIQNCLKGDLPVIKSNNPLRYRLVSLLLKKRKMFKNGRI